MTPTVPAARLVALAISLAWLGYVLISWVLLWNPADAGAYYDAAARLRDGQTLYTSAHPEAHEVYRYAPWFAYTWIPLTYLPRDPVLHGWSLLMLACSAVAVWPLLRLRTSAAVALAALTGAFLAETAMFGNAHPAVVALLVLSVTRRGFPVAVAVAASIKFVPIAFAAVWLARRQWSLGLAALGTTVVLWAHALLFDLKGYVTDPGTGLLSVYAISPVLWLAVAGTAAAVTLAMVVRGSRWAWIAVATLMFIGPPRVVLSYMAFLIPAVLLTLQDDAHREGA